GPEPTKPRSVPPANSPQPETPCPPGTRRFEGDCHPIVRGTGHPRLRGGMSAPVISSESWRGLLPSPEELLELRLEPRDPLAQGCLLAEQPVEARDHERDQSDDDGRQLPD